MLLESDNVFPYQDVGKYSVQFLTLAAQILELDYVTKVFSNNREGTQPLCLCGWRVKMVNANKTQKK